MYPKEICPVCGGDTIVLIGILQCEDDICGWSEDDE